MQEKTWLEISLTVDGELAEAVAEVLARYVPNGVAIEASQIAPDPEGPGYPVGPVRVCGYLAADVDIEETRQRIEEGLWYLSRISPMPAPTLRLIQEVNWVETWKQHYQPIVIGRRLMITPAWLDNPDPQRIPIRIDPGMAFGTGTHPTTQLCLALAETYTRPGRPAIDLGCGSGILAIAALKLGASLALGVDIDIEAVDASLQNAALNGIEAGPASPLTVHQGSQAEILAGQFELRQAPLVFANILAPVLVRLLDEGLGQMLEPDGCALLSGILAEQEASVLQAAERNGLKLLERRQIGDWVALALTPVASA